MNDNTELLLSYRCLISSISHFTNYSNIDKRAFKLTAHVDGGNDLHKIRNLISIKLNKLVMGNGSSTDPSRPALIIADDVEGSKDLRPNLENPLYRHFHGLIVLSEDTVNMNPDTDAHIADMQNTILSIREIGKEPRYWKLKLSIPDSVKRKLIPSVIKDKYSDVIAINEDATGEVVLKILREDQSQISKCNKLIEDIKTRYPAIDSIERITDYNKKVEIEPCRNDQSIFNWIGYSTKLVSKGQHDRYDFGVYPFDVDVSKDQLKETVRGKSDKLFNAVLNDPSIAFSNEYLLRFSSEFGFIRAEDQRDRRLPS